jgi:hypothetical protein
MPRALQLVTGFFTAAGAGTNIVTPSGGDTFTVSSFDVGSPAYLEQAWATNTADDFARIRSARMHDANQGIRMQLAGYARQPLLPYGMNQQLYPVDTPTVEIDATGAGSDAISVLYSWQDLPGVQPRLANWADVEPRILEVSGVDVLVSACAAIGAYSPGVALNSSFDNFQAGSDYALLGYQVASPTLSIAIIGQDTGNLKVGGPGFSAAPLTQDWFISLGVKSGRPCIPIIAANNKGATLVSQVDNTAHAAQHVTLILAQLG